MEGTHVAVVGAGAFGGWTALWLRRKGARVTLLDAWGPGHSRSSSGDETRVIRGIYGPDRLYVDWTARSFPLWRELEAARGARLYHRTGALWMFGDQEGGDEYARASLPLLHDAGLPAAELDMAEAARRFPQVDFAGIRSVFVEEEAGFLAARRGCRVVAEALAAEGGEYRQLAVQPGALAGGRMERLELSDGSHLEADAYVFACGPWLGQVFPDAVGGKIRPTRQEIFYFGTPAGNPSYGEDRFPVWFEFGELVHYGIPGNDHRGFKWADDTRREETDPTTMDRTPTPERLEAARRHLARRFPGLAGAPVVESRVCQYENSPDGHLFIDRHPEAGNAWIVGGGSGHGYKFGPALGEHVAGVVLGETKPLARFALGREAMPPPVTLPAGVTTL
jgi:glycine/D-amino acid oxidase-like deaminating enzyme